MTTITIDVSQLSALATELAARGAKVGAQVSTATRKAGAEVERASKILAPVDTGYLRSSISTTITGGGNSSQVAAEVGPTANYGIYVEEGTSRMRPQPYMGPALDRVAPMWVAAIRQIASGRI